MKWVHGPAIGTVVLVLARGAFAQEDCPPGSWVCVPTPPPENKPVEPRPPSSSPTASPGEVTSTEEPPSLAPALPPPPPPVEATHNRPWALRSHLLLPFVGAGSTSSFLMGGVGLGGRWRPEAPFAMDLNLDALTGNDYSGNRRDELAIDFATHVFFNPRDAVQVFLAAGVGWSRADISWSREAALLNAHSNHETYTYFGMLAGLGAEWRVRSHLSLELALFGMIRGRVDSKANDTPEFVDNKTHLATNTSGAGLLRLGLLYYF